MRPGFTVDRFRMEEYKRPNNHPLSGDRMRYKTLCVLRQSLFLNRACRHQEDTMREACPSPAAWRESDNERVVMRKKKENMGFSKEEISETSLPEGATRKCISDLTRFLLWSKSGGRCQLCNKLLYKSSLTQQPVNVGVVAHIIPANQNGPRGREEPEMSEADRASFGNLMLLCGDCHHEIDTNDKRYTAAILREKKRRHEARIEMVTGIDENNKSMVLSYSAPINEVFIPIDEKQSYDAVRVAGYYPEKDHACDISFNYTGVDKNAATWQVLSEDLENRFHTELYPLIVRGLVSHLSIFALAPMPLLMKLGTLLTDKLPVSVYQRHRLSQNWIWPNVERFAEFSYKEISSGGEIPALLISLSGRIQLEMVHQAIGDSVDVWELTLKDDEPNVNCIINSQQLAHWRAIVRTVLEAIRQKYPRIPLRVFPAMPVSTAVEFGRARLPKIDAEWVVYDYNQKTQSFIETLTIK